MCLQALEGISNNVSAESQSKTQCAANETKPASDHFISTVVSGDTRFAFISE